MNEDFWLKMSLGMILAKLDEMNDTSFKEASLESLVKGNVI
jgi:hypothetical protein